MPEDEWISEVSPYIDDEEAEAVKNVLVSRWLTEGQECRAFVEEMKALVGARFGVLAPNGTLALALGVMAMGLGPGDEVLIPDVTFIGSATAVLLAGARPVFVDVDPVNFQIDLSDAERRVCAVTRAIMPVHLYGTACDLDALSNFASKYSLKIIEDAAQGIGVRHRGRHVGSIGEVGCFSFFADKTITMGEGGFVATQDAAIYERLRLLRNQGRLTSGTFIHPAVGYNLRITDIQASIGRIQLRKLDKIVAIKQMLHREYIDCLNDVKSVRVVRAVESANIIPFRCAILSENAEGLRQYLSESKIQSRSFFYPLHRQPALAQLYPGGSDDAQFPNAMAAWQQGTCLPLHCMMSRGDVDRIAKRIRSFYAS